MAKEAQSPFAAQLEIKTEYLDEAAETSRESDRRALIAHGKDVYRILTVEDPTKRFVGLNDLTQRIGSVDTYGPVQERMLQRLSPLVRPNAQELSGLDKDNYPNTPQAMMREILGKVRDLTNGGSAEGTPIFDSTAGRIDNALTFIQGMSVGGFEAGNIDFATQAAFLGTNGDPTSSPAVMDAVYGLKPQGKTQAAIRIREMERLPEATQAWQV